MCLFQMARERDVFLMVFCLENDNECPCSCLILIKLFFEAVLGTSKKSFVVVCAARLILVACTQPHDALAVLVARD